MTRIPSRRLRPFSLAAVIAGAVVLLVPVPHVLAKLAPQSTPVEVATDVHVSAAQTRAIANAVVHATVDSVARATTDSVTGAVASAASPTPKPSPSQLEQASPEPAASAQSETKPEPSTQPHSDYIDRMKAAGYDVDLDKLIAMKIQGVTPEYADAMAKAGFGKLSADDLIACKIQGVNPETIAEMKKQGLEVNSVHDAISFRIFNVTPEFVEGMKAAGFGGLSSKELVNMRIQGVTPEFARKLKQKFPQVTADDLIKARIFRIDDEFMAQVERHGFNNLPFDKLVKLRISGLFDDESVKP